MANFDPVYRTEDSFDGYVWVAGAKVPDSWQRNNSYSFANIHVRALIPYSIQNKGNQSLTEIDLYNVSLLSVSTHRDQYPVVSLGRRGIKGITNGHRICAGTLGFSFISENAFAPLIREYAAWMGNAHFSSTIAADELPPFDLLVLLKGEKHLDDASYFLIQGVQIVDTARNISTTEIVMSETYSFMAHSIYEINDINQFNYVTEYDTQEEPDSGDLIAGSILPTIVTPSVIYALTHFPPTGFTLDLNTVGSDDTLSNNSSGGLGQPCANCLVKGSGILTPTGYKKIEDLKISDTVVSWNGAVETIIAVQEILNQKVVAIRTPLGEFECSTTHRLCVDIMNPHKYKLASALSISDKLIGANNELIDIIAVTVLPLNKTVYNITLSGPDNTYLSCGVRHHNKFVIINGQPVDCDNAGNGGTKPGIIVDDQDNNNNNNGNLGQGGQVLTQLSNPLINPYGVLSLPTNTSQTINTLLNSSTDTVDYDELIENEAITLGIHASGIIESIDFEQG